MSSGMLLGILLVLSIVSSACGSSLDDVTANPPSDVYELDPVFGAIYNHLGGVEEAGVAISAPLKNGSTTQQYLETALLIYDSAAPISSKFQIAPLGLELGIREPPVPVPQVSSIHYVEGHTIAPEFYEFYDTLKPYIVGKPLTEPRYHLVRKRYEQFFENIGFYREEGSTEVHLLPYGLWACRQPCQVSGVQNSFSSGISNNIDPGFKEYVDISGTDFTGLALTDLYLDVENRGIQIFENLVMSKDMRQDDSEIRLLPLSEAVNIKAENLHPPSFAQGMYFFPVQDQLGYEIPTEIWEYIQDNGGINLIGKPITHFSQLTKSIYHQCFEYICLTYDSSLVLGARVHPEPLGFAYKALYYDSEIQRIKDVESFPLIPSEVVDEPSIQQTSSGITDPISQDSNSAEVGQEINLRVWQRYGAVEPDQRQEIQIWLEENGESAANKIVDLTISMPDGTQQFYRMVPTNLEGQSSLMLPVIEAKNGTIISYKACYSATPVIKFCDADIFVIWNNP